MNLPDHYLMTVALHAVVLSAAVFLAILGLRKPQRIALVALCGTLAIATLPWVSALRPRPTDVVKEAGEPGVSAVTRLPQWTVVRIPTVEQSAVASPASLSPTAMPEVSLVAATWASGALIAMAALLSAFIKVRRWQRALMEPDEAAWQVIRDAAPDAPDRRHFRISPAEGSPCVAGFFKPLVVIPLSLLDPARRRELRWALRHELRHWQGSDSRWTMVLEGIRVSQWWNPFVHGLIARWKMSREFVCDLAASDDDRSAYGEFLIEMAAKPAARPPLAVTMVRHRRLKALRARILAVLKAAPGSAVPFEKSVLFSACGALIAASLMISCVGIEGRDTASVGAGSGEENTPPQAAAVTNARRSQLPAGATVQVKISTKILFPSGGPAAADGSVLSEAEMQQLMRRIAQTKGTVLMTMPAVTARSDETAMIELIREHPDDPPWQADPSRPQLRQNRFTGWSFLMTPTYEGKKVRFATDIGYGFVPGKHFSANRPNGSAFEEIPKIAWKKLVRKNARGEAMLAPGETLAVNLGEVERGLFATVFMTVVPIDTTGREMKSFKEAIYRQKPPKGEVSGKVRLKGILLDDLWGAPPLEADGTHLGMASIFSADQWKQVEEEIGGKSLGEATLEYGSESEPWPELPGVKIAVRRYKEEPHLEVRFTFPGTLSENPGFQRRFSLACKPGTAIVSHLAVSSDGKPRGLIVIVEDPE